MYKPNILIGTPAYGGQVHADFVHSLIGIQAAKDAGLLDYSLMTITNESLITRGRNTIISTFYHSKEFTHLFFVDADLGFPKELLPQLLKQDKDLIGQAVPLKGYDEKGNHVLNVGKVISAPNEELLEVEHVGNALMLMSRKIAEDLCDNSDKYIPSNLTRGNKQTKSQFDVFQVGVKDGIYLSEDYFVCSKARELGYTVYVLNKNIQVRHNGNYCFTN